MIALLLLICLTAAPALAAPGSDGWHQYEVTQGTQLVIGARQSPRREIEPEAAIELGESNRPAIEGKSAPEHRWRELLHSGELQRGQTVV